MNELSVQVKVPCGRHPLLLHRLDEGTRCITTHCSAVYAGEEEAPAEPLAELEPWLP